MVTTKNEKEYYYYYYVKNKKVNNIRIEFNIFYCTSLHKNT